MVVMSAFQTFFLRGSHPRPSFGQDTCVCTQAEHFFFKKQRGKPVCEETTYQKEDEALSHVFEGKKSNTLFICVENLHLPNITLIMPIEAAR